MRNPEGQKDGGKKGIREVTDGGMFTALFTRFTHVCVGEQIHQQLGPGHWYTHTHAHTHLQRPPKYEMIAARAKMKARISRAPR